MFPNAKHKGYRLRIRKQQVTYRICILGGGISMAYRVMTVGGALTAAAGFTLAVIIFFRFGILEAFLHMRYAWNESRKGRRKRKSGGYLFLILSAAVLSAAGIPAEGAAERVAFTGNDPFETGPWPAEDDAFRQDEDGSPEGEAMPGGISPWTQNGEGEEASRDGAREGQIRILMEGGCKDREGRWFYRSDNCMIRVLFPKPGEVSGQDGNATDRHILLDGEDVTDLAVLYEEAGGEKVYELSAEQVNVILTEDGEHRIDVFAEEGEIDTEGVEASLTGGNFVLDRVPPVCSVQIIPDEARFPFIRGGGERYYLSSGYKAVFSFTDTNLDPELLEVAAGCVRDGLYSSEEVEIRSFPLRLPVSSFRAEDVVSTDGVYRYSVRGCDKAGNAPLPAHPGELDVEGKTPHIVVDRVRPEGTVVITAGKKVLIAMRTGGTSKRSAASAASKAAIWIRTDIRKERSPVRIRAEVTSSPGLNRKKYGSGRYAYGASVRISLRGKRQFRIRRLILEDLAGNRTVFRMGGRVYLDPDPPGVRIAALSGPDGETRDGRPLFKGDVSFDISARDPEKGRGGTGLSLVSFQFDSDAAGGSAGKKTLYQARDGKAAFLYEGTVSVKSGELEGNMLSVSAAAADGAGNQSESVCRIAIDRTAPHVEMTFPGHEGNLSGILSASLRGIILVRDRNFTPAGVSLTTGKEVPLLEWKKTRTTDAGEEVWEAEAEFAEDGVYTLKLHAEDAAGNRSGEVFPDEAENGIFMIDTTPPRILVRDTGGAAKHGIYYPEGRRLIIEVKDASFAGTHTIRWIRDGKEEKSAAFSGNRAVLDMPSDGEYIVRGDVTDGAGNRTALPETEAFIVDKTAPEVVIEGVKPYSANPDAVTVQVTVRDAHLESNCLRPLLKREDGTEEILPCLPEETGEGFRFSFAPFEEDGLYRLFMTGTDLAGNRTEEACSFTVNRNGTVFEFEQEEISGRWLREGVRPSFILHDVDEVTVLSVTVNGEETPYTYKDTRLALKDALTEDGIYRIGIETVDAAGHAGVMEEKEVKIDRTPPVLTVLGLGSGHAVKAGPVTIRLIPDDPDAVFCELKLDGQTVSAAPGGADGGAVIRAEGSGEHVLTAQLADPAGNVSERCERRFLITRNPLLLLTGNRPLFFLLIAVLTGGIVFMLFKNAPAFLPRHEK